MNIAELHELPSIEKLKIIEALWSDLAGDESSLNSFSWHETELKKTESEFLAGNIEAVDWQQAKQILQDKF
ncbi:MAG: acyl-protein synthetase [Methylococcaceae bacterium]|nr:acyl-protein synthetase [Methylococcaceae bacterium]